jgi:hypothetical protein
MFRRTFAMMLSAMVLLTALGFQRVGAQVTDIDQASEKIRTKIQKIGVGGNARVEVKLRDNSQLKGHISDAGLDSYTLIDSKTGSSKTISYADTSTVKKAGGGGVSGKTWLILGAAVVGAIVTWVIVKPALCDGGAQTRGPC